MSRILTSLVLLSAVTAQAECYTRSSTVSKLTASIEQIADVERKVLPSGNGKNLCRITFRAYINNKWHTAQGEEIGSVNDSLDNICAKALNSGRVSILESVSGTKITGSQELICTDEPKPKQIYLDTEVVFANGLLNLIPILEKLICIKESSAEVLTKRFGEWLTSGNFHSIIYTSHTQKGQYEKLYYRHSLWTYSSNCWIFRHCSNVGQWGRHS
jgi:hypothetical protein